MNEVQHTEAIDGLNNLEDSSITGVITDPPYGLSSHANIEDVLRAWLDGKDHDVKGGGFMGMAWDSFCPPPSLWREVYRVLKPGGFAFVFAGTRSMDLMSISLRLAGFEYRDTMMYLYGSGFPKSHDISKGIDKAAGVERDVVGKSSAYRKNAKKHKVVARGVFNGDAKITAPATSESEKWEGYGTALKPSYEPILIFMKPLDGTFAGNAIEHGVAGLNIDKSRVGMETGLQRPERRGKGQTGGWANYEQAPGNYGTPDGKGRWPSNTALSHHPECEYVGEKEVGSGDAKVGGKPRSKSTHIGQISEQHRDNSIMNYGKETVEDWNCHPECPIYQLDQMSGTLKSGALKSSYTQKASQNNAMSGPNYERQMDDRSADQGGASRFFYTSKAPKKERNMGCEDLYWRRDKNSNTGFVQITKEEYDTLPEKDRIQGNPHPTVKPVGIMRWLVKMLTMPEGTRILDPFAGSGTTGVACALEEVEFLGFDSGKEYVTIGNSRINYAKNFPESFQDKKQSKSPTKRQPTAKKGDTKDDPPSIADW